VIAAVAALAGFIGYDKVAGLAAKPAVDCATVEAWEGQVNTLPPMTMTLPDGQVLEAPGGTIPGSPGPDERESCEAGIAVAALAAPGAAGLAIGWAIHRYRTSDHLNGPTDGPAPVS
jgi:hypothetical protein